MALRLSTVFEKFEDEFSVLKKGELHLESDDISQFLFENGVAKAKVLASYKKCQYDVEVIQIEKCLHFLNVALPSKFN